MQLRALLVAQKPCEGDVITWRVYSNTYVSFIVNDIGTVFSDFSTNDDNPLKINFLIFQLCRTLQRRKGLIAPKVF